MRAGVELETAEVATLARGAVVHAVETATNAKGDARVRIGKYGAVQARIDPSGRNATCTTPIMARVGSEPLAISADGATFVRAGRALRCALVRGWTERHGQCHQKAPACSCVAQTSGGFIGRACVHGCRADLGRV